MVRGFLFFFFLGCCAPLDLLLTRWFHSPEIDAFPPYPFWTLLYTYGAWPALFVGIGGLFVGLASLFRSDWAKIRLPAFYLAATLACGSGLITHGILKEYWQRPRPRQTIEFGGDAEFRPWYSPQWKQSGESMHSFPSGHASTGFYFFSFIFLGRRYHLLVLERLGWFIAIGLGGAMSAARIAVGAHFLSDTLAAAGVMWISAYFLDRIFFRNRYERVDQATSENSLVH